MSGELFKRSFGVSAFEAVRNIRVYQRQNPNLPLKDIVSLIQTIDPGGFDFVGGTYLHGRVPLEAEPLEPVRFYRYCIETIIYESPIWTRSIVLGRKKFCQKLERDEEQCFRLAGLLEDLADEVVQWWDAIAAQSRQLSDIEAMKRARAAERLSLEHEEKRMKRLGIEREPEWMSLEDNTAGYDILSYDLGHTEPVTRLIEVKSTIASPLRFIVTRHEWNTALRFGERYFFHVWDLRVPRLYERSAEQIKSNIPSDNKPGQWTRAEIPIAQT